MRIQGAKPMRSRILVRLWCHKKLNFYMKNILYVGIRSQNIWYLCRYKSLLKGWASGLFVNFGLFSGSWIRICNGNADPDPLEQNQCGSGSKTLLYVWAQEVRWYGIRDLSWLRQSAAFTTNKTVVRSSAVEQSDNDLPSPYRYQSETLSQFFLSFNFSVFRMCYRVPYVVYGSGSCSFHCWSLND